MLLKRIAEALEAGFLTLEECQRATARIDLGYVRVFDCKRSEAAERAAQVSRIIQLILQQRFPGRFRAEPPAPKLSILIAIRLIKLLHDFSIILELEQSALIVFFFSSIGSLTVRSILSVVQGFYGPLEYLTFGGLINATSRSVSNTPSCFPRRVLVFIWIGGHLSSPSPKLARPKRAATAGPRALRLWLSS